RWQPCSTPAENRSADSRKSCWRRCDRFSFSRRQWPAASTDEPLSTRQHVVLSDRRSSRRTSWLALLPPTAAEASSPSDLDQNAWRESYLRNEACHCLPSHKNC